MTGFSMNMVSHKTRLGVQPAEYTYEWLPLPSGFEFHRQTESRQAVDLAGNAHTQAMHAEGQPGKRGKRARLPQGKITAFEDEVQNAEDVTVHAGPCRLVLSFLCTSARSRCALQVQGLSKRQKAGIDVHEPASTGKKEISRLNSCSRQLQAGEKQLQAVLQAVRPKQEQKREGQRHSAMEMMEMRMRSILYGGVHASSIHEGSGLRRCMAASPVAFTPAGSPYSCH